MIVLGVGTNTVVTDSYVELIVLLLVFFLILFAAYYVTKLIAKKGLLRGKTQNIELIESFRLNQNKMIQIVRIGNKYIAIGVSKDHFEYLTEVDPEELDLTPVEASNKDVSFKEVIQNVVKGQKNTARDGNSIADIAGYTEDEEDKEA